VSNSVKIALIIVAGLIACAVLFKPFEGAHITFELNDVKAIEIIQGE